MRLTREFLRRGAAIGMVLVASSIAWGPSATASRALSSSRSAALQGGCGYTTLARYFMLSTQRWRVNVCGGSVHELLL